MNIFVLDTDVTECVKQHVDKHVVKMILESAQMLSTAVQVANGIETAYRKTHENHPCSKWVRASLSNWLWLRELTYRLQDEWRYRYGHTRKHKSIEVVDILPLPKIEDTGLTPFALAMPEQFKSSDPVKSYRDYYIHEKRHIAKWTKRGVPDWFRSV